MNNNSFKEKSSKLAKERGLYRDDKIMCERCIQLDFRFKKSAVHVHHKNTNRKDNRNENLILVCSDCHRALHKELKYGTSDTNPYLPTLGLTLSEFLYPQNNPNNNNNNLIQYYNIVLDNSRERKRLEEGD